MFRLYIKNTSKTQNCILFTCCVTHHLYIIISIFLLISSYQEMYINTVMFKIFRTTRQRSVYVYNWMSRIQLIFPSRYHFFAANYYVVRMNSRASRLNVRMTRFSNSLDTGRLLMVLSLPILSYRGPFLRFYVHVNNLIDCLFSWHSKGNVVISHLKSI